MKHRSKIGQVGLLLLLHCCWQLPLILPTALVVRFYQIQSKPTILGTFYQAKSIKQSIAEGQLEESKDFNRKEQLRAKISRYESDPATGEGKKELMARALQIEAERDQAKKHTPWLTFAAMAFQLAIVLLSASILAVDKRMFWGSLGVSAFGVLLLIQGIWLVAPLVI